MIVEEVEYSLTGIISLLFHFKTLSKLNTALLFV